MPVDPAARGLTPRKNPQGGDLVFVSPTDYSQPGWVPADGLHYQDTPVVETFSGTPRIRPFYTLARKKTYSYNGTLYSYDGITIESFVYIEVSNSLNGLITGFTLNNVVNVNGNFDYNSVSALSTFPISAPNLKSIGGNLLCLYSDPISLNMPVLEIIAGNFAPMSWDSATGGVTLPALKIIGGDFNPNNCYSAQAWSFPALTTVYNTFKVDVLGATSISCPALTNVGWMFTIQGCTANVGLTFTNLSFVGSSFTIQNNAALTSISNTAFPALSACNYMTIKNNTVMTSVSFPALTSVFGGSFLIDTMPALTSISVPNLAYLYSGLSFKTCNAIVSMSFPALASTDGTNQWDTLNSLTTISLPALVRSAGSLTFKALPALTSLTFPALTQLGVKTNTSGQTIYGQGGFQAQTCAALTAINFPVVNYMAGIDLSVGGTAAVTTITFGVPFVRCDGNINITSAALNQTTVDLILSRLAALDGTGGTSAYSSPKTVKIQGTSATPSAAGLTSKATLVARGVTVTHN